MVKDQLRINIDLNVLNHLGIGLYSNTPAVLTEIVANAWDADAENVNIQIDSEADKIIISDDGCGMTYSELKEKFLTVGYARRDRGFAITEKKERQCMGRKGIGKLAMFSLANDIRVVSVGGDGERNGFQVNVSHLKEEIKSGGDCVLEPVVDFLDHELSVVENGTVITLSALNKNVNRTAEYLRKRISRRFSVIGGEDFEVVVNGRAVTLADRGFYDSIQFLWTFGGSEGVRSLCPNMVQCRHFDGLLPGGSVISGFIGSAFMPEQLKAGGDSNNTITLISNGRIFEEDIQKRMDDSKVFNSYLVGEIKADHMDDNSLEDIAVSSRQGVREDDPRFQEFIGYMKTRLVDIAKDWDGWRRDVGGDELESRYPAVKAWLEGLKPAVRPLAKRLIGRTNAYRFSGSEEEQDKSRRGVIKAQIIAFERLQIKENIMALDTLDIGHDVAGFTSVLNAIEDIEASMYCDVVRQRLSVIKKLDQHRQDQVRERVVQDHIYEHLWLVDSSWEYKQHPTDFELRLSDYLKQACPDTEEGARLDIAYRTTSGKYIVLELKKPGLTISMNKLYDQGEKYMLALQQYFYENPGSSPVSGGTPVIDIVFIVDKRPSVPAASREFFDRKMENLRASIRTYNDLITQATSSYEEFLKASKQVDSIKSLLAELDAD